MKDFKKEKDHMKGRYRTTLEIRNNQKKKKKKRNVYIKKQKKKFKNK